MAFAMSTEMKRMSAGGPTKTKTDIGIEPMNPGARDLAGAVFIRHNNRRHACLNQRRSWPAGPASSIPGLLMASRRRLGLENSATRGAIIEAAARVLVEEGFAALTSRRVSQRAGVGSQLVHYYFRTMDDLMVAVIRREGDEALKSAVRAAGSLEPLRELWELETKAKASAVYSELASLASHNQKLREEIVRYAEQGRAFQAEAIAQHFAVRGIESPISPLAAALFMSAAARLLVREGASGMSLGHREAQVVIEKWLTRLSPATKHAPRPASAASETEDRPARTPPRSPKRTSKVPSKAAARKAAPKRS
jgi:TetR/AcrR family transcriptional regulator